MAILGVRIWRTNDGRYVPDGHPAAAFLAYGPSDDVPDHAIPQSDAEPATEPEAKAADQAPNKQRKPQAKK